MSQEWEDAGWRRSIEDRLTYELGVIERMGYSDYFLILCGTSSALPKRTASWSAPAEVPLPEVS
ncbi:hypothetical protein [Paenibacillus silviterrae]|uniref:hypothetical protein n=1 Tax=Paenibacillus silviterrae TaxID=3242194 RepID=UPI002542CD35|nr:hypothetical protein [Paenibacillus chinjuensis]